MVDGKKKTLSQSRWRAGRISIRVHDDLKRALEYLAEADRRTLSQYLELIALDHARAKLKNAFANDGSLEPGERQEFALRSAPRR
jgi:predicted transcriptional regulator